MRLFNVIDLLVQSCGNGCKVSPFAFGTLEYTFDLSLCDTDLIKCVKYDGKIYRYNVNDNKGDIITKWIEKQ